MFDANYMLIKSTADVTADANGSALDVKWPKEMTQTFKLVAPAVTGTNPTLDVKIQGSNDNGTNYADIISFPQLTAAGVKYVRCLVPYKTIRAVIDVGGTTPNFGKVLCGIVPAGQYNQP